jgi:hypothetical protein
MTPNNNQEQPEATTEEIRRNPDELKKYFYTAEEVEALRRWYEEDQESGSVMS